MEKKLLIPPSIPLILIIYILLSFYFSDSNFPLFSTMPAEKSGTGNEKAAGGSAGPVSTPEEKGQREAEQNPDKESSEGTGGGGSAAPSPAEDTCPEFRNLSIFQFSYGYKASNGGPEVIGGWRVEGDIKCSLLEYLENEAFFCEVGVMKGSTNKTVTAVYSQDNATYIETLCG